MLKNFEENKSFSGQRELFVIHCEYIYVLLNMDHQGYSNSSVYPLNLTTIEDFFVKLPIVLTPTQ